MGLFGNIEKSREMRKREVFEHLSEYDSMLFSERLVSIQNKLQLMLDSKTSRRECDPFSDEEKEILETLLLCSTSKTEFAEPLIQKGVNSHVAYNLYSMLQSEFEIMRRNVWTTGLIEIYD